MFQAQLYLGASLIHKKTHRSKALVVLLMPALIIIGLIGALMYTSGNHYHRPSKLVRRNRKESKGEGVTFLTANCLEKVQVINK